MPTGAEAQERKVAYDFRPVFVVSFFFWSRPFLRLFVWRSEVLITSCRDS